ncbi:hypothetical protein RRG08_064231 [Elysia crispata]|uniref:Uncharacterized protein n=1 Tax=Elysia crispata TaxID=231223 RepID=A0AAE0YE76_9GAST|nr:hypothetical protein RRG08_064231 [Elysia crispata]
MDTHNTSDPVPCLALSLEFSLRHCSCPLSRPVSRVLSPALLLSPVSPSFKPEDRIYLCSFFVKKYESNSSHTVPDARLEAERLWSPHESRGVVGDDSSYSPCDKWCDIRLEAERLWSPHESRGVVGDDSSYSPCDKWCDIRRCVRITGCRDGYSCAVHGVWYEILLCLERDGWINPAVRSSNTAMIGLLGQVLFPQLITWRRPLCQLGWSPNCLLMLGIVTLNYGLNYYEVLAETQKMASSGSGSGAEASCFTA